MDKVSRFGEVYFVMGTRAQFIKVAPLMRKMKDKGLKYKLIYTAQHKETIENILDIYDLPAPDYSMYSDEEANTKFRFIKWMFSILYQVIFKAKKILPHKGIVLTHGDTFTTWMAALMAKIAGCKVGHLESGLRSHNIFAPFPEEISRLITFSLTDVYYCPSQWAIDNVKKYKGEKINMMVNPMYDGVVFAAENSHKSDKAYSFLGEDYGVISIHRYENIFNKRFTEFILPTLEKIAKEYKLVMTMHPTTRERLKKLNLFDRLDNNKQIELHERFDFISWITICKNAKFVISDGGSNQEELSYLGTPTLLMREVTERKEGLGENVILSKYDSQIIDEFVKDPSIYKRDPIKFKESPSEIILNHLYS